MEALKQQWPDQELFWYTIEIASEIVTERCARTSKEKQTSGSWRCNLNETATECAWNANESRDAGEEASWDEAGSWEAEEDQFEGSFADEEEEEKLFNLAGTQLNEAFASERDAKRTVA